MWAILGLSIVLGMQHALDADHVAAVSTLISEEKDRGRAVRHGLTWGLGHTITLFIFAGVAMLLGNAIPPLVKNHAEALVGVMLVALGINLLWKLYRNRVHFHGHRHDTEKVHFHAHSHKGEDLPHQLSRHDHVHKFQWRTLLVGLIHGLAGSAVLLVLTVTQIDNPMVGIAYILLFGIGSMVGMALLSVVILWPLTYAARTLTNANRILQFALAALTIFIGSSAIFA